MNRDIVKTKLFEILKNQTRDKDAFETFTETSSIILHLNISSVRFVDLIIDLEDEFDVVIDDQTMLRILTLNDGVDVISELLENK